MRFAQFEIEGLTVFVNPQQVVSVQPHPDSSVCKTYIVVSTGVSVEVNEHINSVVSRLECISGG